MTRSETSSDGGLVRARDGDGAACGGKVDGVAEGRRVTL